jgi:hypothetical protein
MARVFEGWPCAVVPDTLLNLGGSKPHAGEDNRHAATIDRQLAFLHLAIDVFPALSVHGLFKAPRIQFGRPLALADGKTPR